MFGGGEGMTKIPSLVMQGNRSQERENCLEVLKRREGGRFLIGRKEDGKLERREKDLEVGSHRQALEIGMGAKDDKRSW
ncbi:hypothetical protein ACLOJK_041175 [Asimina triloba]